MNLAEILSLAPASADHRLWYGPETLQFGDLRLPAGPGPYPVVVFVHGGYWRAEHSLEHAGHLCAALTGRGFATWSLEYRRVGQPGGGWPGTFLDVAAGADHVRVLADSFPLDLGRVVVMGHSAGGHLALWLAARHRIPSADALGTPAPLAPRGAVALAACSDLRLRPDHPLYGSRVDDLMGGSPDAVPERYATASPFELLPLGVPQVLIHGDADDRVPYAISQRYQAAALAEGDDVELITLPGGDHFEVIDPRTRAWPIVLGAAQRLAHG